MAAAAVAGADGFFLETHPGPGARARATPRRSGRSTGSTRSCGRTLDIWARAHDRRRAWRDAIRLLGLDVDGVLTDNGIFLGAVDGQVVELKRFDIQDGLGQCMMRSAGLPVVWVSGRVLGEPPRRARASSASRTCSRCRARTSSRRSARCSSAAGSRWDEAAFVGDDLADLRCSAASGCPIAVAMPWPR